MILILISILIKPSSRLFRYFRFKFQSTGENNGARRNNSLSAASTTTQGERSLLILIRMVVRVIMWMMIRMMMRMFMVSQAFNMSMLRRDDCYHGEERRESVPESVGSAGRGDLLFTLTSTSSRLFIDIIIITKILITNNMDIFSSICRRPLLSLSLPKQESSEQFLIAPGGI